MSQDPFQGNRPLQQQQQQQRTRHIQKSYKIILFLKGSKNRNVFCVAKLSSNALLQGRRKLRDLSRYHACRKKTKLYL